MKNILLLIALMTAGQLAHAVCNTPISRINVSDKPTSTRHNGDMNTLYQRVNDLPGDCLVDSSIATGKIPDSSVTTDKISDGTITATKLADGLIPSFGRLLRIKAYTTSGTWQRPLDVGSIFVQVVGGGGAGGNNATEAYMQGQNSSFGGFCVAYGGSRGAGTSVGIGGVAELGHVNVAGENGAAYHSETQPRAGYSFLGTFGKGGAGKSGHASGGAGGYCARVLSRNQLPADVSFTVGQGGTPVSNGHKGANGIVIIYEYGI